MGARASSCDAGHLPREAHLEQLMRARSTPPWPGTRGGSAAWWEAQGGCRRGAHRGADSAAPPVMPARPTDSDASPPILRLTRRSLPARPAARILRPTPGAGRRLPAQHGLPGVGSEPLPEMPADPATGTALCSTPGAGSRPPSRRSPSHPTVTQACAWVRRAPTLCSEPCLIVGGGPAWRGRACSRGRRRPLGRGPRPQRPPGDAHTAGARPLMYGSAGTILTLMWDASTKRGARGRVAGAS